jgi:SAM-dependent methyltransferase
MPAAHLRTNQPAPKPYKGIAMEGPIAKWYTNVRERDQELGAVVREVSEILPAGSRILEVAPGPGYLAIELAKIGKYQIVGLDISKSFVEIAQTKAKEAGVAVDFRHGSASGGISIMAGTLDDSSWFTPQADIYTASAQPWDYMHPDLPKFPGPPQT